MLEAQELYCHNCGKHVQFKLDMDLEGNHVLECPNCKHEHCRVVKGGKITGDRWDSRNPMTYTVPVYQTSYSTTSSYSTYTNCSGTTSATSGFMWQAWATTAT